MNRKQFYAIAAILFSVSLPLTTVAQRYSNDGYTPPSNVSGSPAGSYILSGFDTINLYNGRLNFVLPLATIGQRGNARHTISLFIDRKWEVQRTYLDESTFNYSDIIVPPPPSAKGRLPVPYYPPRLYFVHLSSSYYEIAPCSQNPGFSTLILTRAYFIDTDGTETMLVDTASNGTAVPVFPCSTSNPTHNRGRIFSSIDKRMTYIADADIIDHNTRGRADEFAPSGTLMMNDGTRYRFSNGHPVSITDQNGNRIDFTYNTNGFTATDQLGRQYTVDASGHKGFGSLDTISYKGFGRAPRTIRVHYAPLSTVLRQGYVMKPLPQLWPDYPDEPNQVYDPPVVSRVELPGNNLSYYFFYNPYGELARVILPTGGGYDYVWNGDGALGSGANGFLDIRRRVTQRTSYMTLTAATDPNNPPAGSVASKTTYSSISPSPFPNTKTVKVQTYDQVGTLLSESRHHFYDSGSPMCDVTAYSSVWPGREHTTQYYQVTSGVVGPVLSTIEHTFNPSPSGVISPCDGITPPKVQIVSTKNTLNDANLVSKQEYEYDDYSNRTVIKEYGFGAGAPGPLLRRTRTVYLTNNGHQGNVNYATDLNIHIRNLPQEMNVFDSNNNLVSLTYLDYDRYDAFSIQDCPGIVQHDGTFNTVYGRRGNLTLVTKFASLNPNSPIYLHNQYDIAGNVVETVDWRGNPTQFDYSDLFGSPTGGTDTHTPPAELGGQKSYAFPTKVTNALGHETYTKYDYYLGKPVDQSDPNGVDVSWIYSDPLDRLTHVINHANQSSAKNLTKFVYYDNANRIDLYNDLDGLDDGQLWKQTFYDGLGQTYRSSSWENETGTFSIVYTQRDALGRVRRVSNPFRRTAENYFDPPDEAQWTTTEYDTLSRVTRVTTPDGSQVNTQYSGNQVTVTDQAGKRRRSETNALGQLTKVIEAPDELGYGYETSYEYDALNNLRKVKQGSQERIFDYNSLSQLTSATNPESGPVSYKYDENGNLTEKTDARNITTKYKYDKLNRNTEVDYSNTSLTHDIIRLYDNSNPESYGIGRLHAEYARGDFSTGTDTDTIAIDRYDALGRPLSVRQHFKVNGVWKPGETEGFTTSVTYDIPGNVKTMTYPSGHTVSYSHHLSGRLSGFSGKLGDGVNRDYSTDMQYDAAGLIKREQFGTTTPLYLRRHYNNRLQLFDIRLGTDPNQLYDSDNLSDWENAPGSWNRGHLRFFYANYDGNFENFGSGGINNNGNVLRVDHWVPRDDAVSNFVRHFDRYSYDALNRIKSVAEGSHSKAASGEEVYQNVFQQAYVYDRWGNRTIDQGVATGGEVVWVDDGLPAGATAVAAEDGWNWISSNPSPYSGSLSHQSVVAAGAHQHYFQGATQTLDVNAGDRLYTYVYLDPVNPPSEVMLQWNENGSFEHRAYWGADNIPWGVNGTESRRYMGPLPATGGWVRLEVQAILLGLEGKSINGMAFTLYGGRASWDKAGKIGIGSTGINSKAYIVDTTKNRLKPPVGGGTMDYDAAGNLFKDSYTDPTLQEFTYDQENRVVEAKRGGVVVGKYAYDAGGKRTRRLAGGQETWCVYGVGGELVAEYNADSAVGSPQKEYGYRNGQLLVVWDGNETGERQLQWLVQDHLGSTRMVVDRSGSLGGVRRHDFLPFGEELGSGVGIRSASIGYGGDSVRQKFTSKERDAETGLDYFGARYFSPIQGRFTTTDEFKGGPEELWVLGSGDPEKQALVYADITNPQSLNKYQYCFNNPLRYVDPDGRQGQELHYARMHIIKQYETGKISKEEYQRRMAHLDRGSQQASNFMMGAIAIGAAIYYAPGATSAMIGWMLRNPATVIRSGETAAQLLEGGPTSLRMGTLTIAARTGLNAAEISTGARLAKQIGGRIVESAHVGADFVDAVTKKTFDAMGTPDAYKYFGSGKQFFESIVHHVNKSVDHVAIDLMGASKAQIKAIKGFVGGLTKEQQDKIIYIE
jgi:RHS repeat-associated protein